MGFDRDIPIIAQAMHYAVDIGLGLHLQSLGNHFIRWRNAMNTNVCLNEIQYKLSARRHAGTACLNKLSLNVLTNVRKSFFKIYIPPGRKNLERKGEVSGGRYLQEWITV